MIESFVYVAWIGGQVLYWFFLRHQTELLGKEYWQELRSFTLLDAYRSRRHDPRIRCNMALAELEPKRS
jgi:hypothetical protein